MTAGHELTRPRIMIVEDEVVVAIDLEEQVERMGYSVTANVASAEKALVEAERERPDLVLMDISLTGAMDGLEAAEVIRSDLDVPVVFVTAHADEETLGRAQRVLPFGYLHKPFDDRDLRGAIEMALYLARADREPRRTEEEEESEFRRLFAMIPDPAFLVEQETGRVVDVNEAAIEVYGYSREEWLTLRNVDVSAEPEETKKATIEPPPHIPIRYHKKKNGTVFPLEMIANTVTWGDRKLIIVIGKDITTR